MGLLTSDVALLADPEYLSLVQHWAEHQDSFDNMFAYAWYKATSHNIDDLTSIRHVVKNVLFSLFFLFPLQ